MFTKAFRNAGRFVQGSRYIHAQAPSTGSKAGAGLLAAGLCTAAYSLSASRREAQTEGECLRLAGAAVAGSLAGGLAGWYLQHNETAKVKSRYENYWPRKIMVLFGAPGVGKGTQAPKIVDLLDIPQLSTGDMLRAAEEAKTQIGLEAADFMKRGALVPDEVVIRVIKERIEQPDCQAGFILDGFPRTLVQAKALDAMLAARGDFISNVMAFEVPDAVLEERIGGRWIHKASGRSYHVKSNPPKSQKVDSHGVVIPESMKDDVTGEPLMVRPDDNVTALKKRLASYNEQTVPILKHYEPRGVVHHINGNQGIDKVWTDVRQSLR